MGRKGRPEDKRPEHDSQDEKQEGKDRLGPKS